MQKSIIGVALLAASASLCGAAHAQTATPDWSGAYIGLNGGWSSNRIENNSNYTLNQLSGVSAGAGPVTVPSTTFAGNRNDRSRDGFMGGAQLGFNAQSSGFVWGVEGDFDGVSGRQRSNDVFSQPATALTTGSTTSVRRNSDPRWVGTIRLRAGVPINQVLVYATGGVAFVNTHNTENFTYAPTVTPAVTAANPGVTFGPYTNGGNNNETRTGWTLGGGAEIHAAPNVTLGLEYRHTEVGRHSHAFDSNGPNTVSDQFSNRFRDDAVLARVNFRFGGMGGLF